MFHERQLPGFRLGFTTRVACWLAWLFSGWLCAAQLQAEEPRSPLDEAFGVKKVAGDCKFTEGPVATLDGVLFFSDSENDRIMRLDADGSQHVHRQPAGRANGMILDPQGRLIVCQSVGKGGRQRVARFEPDGAETVLADRYNGQPFVAPNDLCQDRQGRIYFTDPIYGRVEDAPQPTSGVYRIDEPGQVVRIIDDLRRPNGILLSPDERWLYVSDRGTQKLHRYALSARGEAMHDRVIYDFSPGRGIDGMTIGPRGNIFGAAGQDDKTGLYVISTEGQLVHFEPMPEYATNVTFGGSDRRDLYLTAGKSVYKMRTLEPGEMFHVKHSAPEPKFAAQTIDDKVQIGYGVAIGDVDGDGKPDILLADKKQFFWYQNPTWKKHLLAENLTVQDNVCIAARDIDGDGKVEIAVGGEWNPSDTTDSGAVFYLQPPTDRAKPWTPVKLRHEPVVHRMRWVKLGENRFALVVAPLHGRGNRNAEGAGVKLYAYHPPQAPGAEWRVDLIDDTMHLTHNLDVVAWNPNIEAEEIVYLGREGAALFAFESGQWRKYGFPRVEGGGEIRAGRLSNGNAFLTTIEPFHGDKLVVYPVNWRPDAGQGEPTGVAGRQVIDDNFNQGHALATGDLLGLGGDQIVAGWRNPNRDGKVGLKLYWPTAGNPVRWQSAWIDEDGMATEDALLADLDGDGRLDIVAAGRATNNLKIYWNQTPPSGD